MELENFISGVIQKSEHGPKRIIYSLSPIGISEFGKAVERFIKFFS